jgi:hypothetical protein
MSGRGCHGTWTGYTGVSEGLGSFVVVFHGEIRTRSACYMPTCQRASSTRIECRSVSLLCPIPFCLLTPVDQVDGRVRAPERSAAASKRGWGKLVWVYLSRSRVRSCWGSQRPSLIHTTTLPNAIHMKQPSTVHTQDKERSTKGHETRKGVDWLVASEPKLPRGAQQKSPVPGHASHSHADPLGYLPGMWRFEIVGTLSVRATAPGRVGISSSTMPPSIPRCMLAPSCDIRGSAMPGLRPPFITAAPWMS